MKFQLISVLAAALGLCATQSARAPYLPSGWRPKGPAFELPTEIKKIQKPSIDTTDVEPEGSMFLKEYGPPEVIKETVSNPVQDLIVDLQPNVAPENVLQDLTLQGLPDKEPNLTFRKVDNTPEDREQINDDEGREENDTNRNVLNVDFARTMTNIEYKKTDENKENVDETIGTMNRKGKDTAMNKNFDIVLVNEQNNHASTEDKSEMETDKPLTEVKNVEKKTDVVAIAEGFREYGPPVETLTSADKFQGATYLPPQELRRDARRVLILRRPRKQH